MFDFSKEIKPDIDTYYNMGSLQLPIHVYLPKGFDKNKKYKTVVAIHGGGWESMLETPTQWDGGWMRHCARYYAALGFVGIVFSYRSIKLSEDTDVSELIADCNDALGYIKKNFAFVDTDNVIFAGDSAGGHLVLSLAMGLTLDKKAEITPRLVIAYNPVTDCTAERWKYCGQTEESAKAASPMDNVKKIDASILLMHGLSDTVVKIDDSRRFYEKMLHAGNDIEMIERPNEEHAFILYGYTATPESVAADYKITEEYIMRKL